MIKCLQHPAKNISKFHIHIMTLVNRKHFDNSKYVLIMSLFKCTAKEHKDLCKCPEKERRNEKSKIYGELHGYFLVAILVRNSKSRGRTSHSVALMEGWCGLIVLPL